MRFFTIKKPEAANFWFFKMGTLCISIATQIYKKPPALYQGFSTQLKTTNQL